MILNEFLNFRLGVCFEDKYNALAVQEILANKEIYPRIVEVIKNEVDDAEYTGKTWDYESGFFDCDDIELCAGFDDTMELYRAFVCAFFNDKKYKTIKPKYVSFGVDYMRRPDTSCIMNPYFDYVGTNYVVLLPNETALVRKIFFPLYSDEEYVGHQSTEEYARTYAADNSEVLQKLTEEIKSLSEKGGLFVNRFESQNMERYSIELENGEIGYPCDCYEICIGRNLLRFFTTERGFDGYTVIRSLFFNCLDDEQKANKVVKIIEATDF